MLLESILKIKGPLISVREHTPNILQDVIPSDCQFSLMEAILPVLKSMKVFSDNMSKDIEPVMQNILVGLFKVNHYLKNYHKSQTVKGHEEVMSQFCESLANHLNKESRFNDMGKNTPAYLMGHLLHPHHRGSLLHEYKIYDDFVRKIIDEHPSTDDFVREHGQSAQALDMDMAKLADDSDDFDDLEGLLNVPENANTSQACPELERELKSFMAMPKVTEKHKVDSLAWWRKHKDTLPLLAQLARDYLCIPVASSTSERLFSASGNIITDKRQSLNPQTSKMLTLVKVNYPYVENKMKVKLISDDEVQEEQEQPTQNTPDNPDNATPSTSGINKYFQPSASRKKKTSKRIISSSSSSPTQSASQSQSQPTPVAKDKSPKKRKANEETGPNPKKKRLTAASIRDMFEDSDSD